MSLELFYSYAHEDEDFRVGLDKQLSILKRSGLISAWHDRQIAAGEQWADQIDQHIRSADIILLLVSADFLASNYCYEVEMQIALERCAQGEAIVIPIILRPVEWAGAPFAHLQAVPKDAKAITLWHNRDEAFADVAKSIASVVRRFRRPAVATGQPRPLVDDAAPMERMLDAAIASHIVKDISTTLEVLVRLPESEGLKGTLQHDPTTDAKPEDVQSKDFQITFPIGPDGKPGPRNGSVTIEAPDFEPPEQVKRFWIPPDTDSDTLCFFVTPRRAGRLPLLVELNWEEAVRGSRRLVTHCVAEAGGMPPNPVRNLVQMPIGVAPSSRGTGLGGVSLEASATSASSAPRPSAPPIQAPSSPEQTRQAAGPEGPGSSALEGPSSSRQDSPLYDAPTPLVQDDLEPSYSHSPAKTKSNSRAAIVAAAAIGAFAIVTAALIGTPVGWFHGGTDTLPVLYTGTVVRESTMSPISLARVTIHVAGGSTFEAVSDSRGAFSINLGEIKKGTTGWVYAAHPNFETLDRTFVVGTPLPDMLLLTPTSQGPYHVSFNAARVDVIGKFAKRCAIDSGELILEVLKRSPADLSNEDHASCCAAFDGPPIHVRGAVSADVALEHEERDLKVRLEVGSESVALAWNQGQTLSGRMEAVLPRRSDYPLDRFCIVVGRGDGEANTIRAGGLTFTNE